MLREGRAPSLVRVTERWLGSDLGAPVADEDDGLGVFRGESFSSRLRRAMLG
jgi:hypothetical protein